MAVETGHSKIVTSGSVFLYDTGDTVNSYKGEPITNQFVVYGTSGYGSGADNAVNFPVQGTVGFVRLGFGQTFGGYTIQPNDVVYKYPLNSSIGGCHYHGMVQSIPAGAYATFTFDYYISPDTDLSTGNSGYLANFENYGNGALGGSVSMPNNLKGVWQTVSFTSGPRGGGVGSQAMFLYPGGCGGNIATNGYILYKNPRVYWLPYDVPFVQGTRSTTQAMIDIVGGNTINLVNMTYGANNALSFDGTDDYITIPSSTVFDTSAVTVEVVVKPNGLVQNGFWFEKGTVNTQYSLFMEGSSIVWRQAVNSQYTATSTMTNNAWNHVAGTFKSGERITYVNGTARTSDSLVYTLNTNQGAQYIGSYNSGGYHYNGQIAVVKVYNRVLSPSEILSNYNHYKTRFNIT
jgi:hypothetical protein